MAHAQKPDLVFRRNGLIHLNRRGASVQSTTGSRGVRISDSNAGYTMFRGSVKGTGYPLHSASFPFTSPPVRQRMLSHFNWSLQLEPNTIETNYLTTEFRDDEPTARATSGQADYSRYINL